MEYGCGALCRRRRMCASGDGMSWWLATLIMAAWSASERRKSPWGESNPLSFKPDAGAPPAGADEEISQDGAKKLDSMAEVLVQPERGRRIVGPVHQQRFPNHILDRDKSPIPAVA